MAERYLAAGGPSVCRRRNRGINRLATCLDARFELFRRARARIFQGVDEIAIAGFAVVRRSGAVIRWHQWSTAQRRPDATAGADALAACRVSGPRRSAPPNPRALPGHS